MTSRTTRHQDPFQISRIALGECRLDRPIDLVAAAPCSRPEGGHQLSGLRSRSQCTDAGLDDTSRQPSPARVDRQNRAAIRPGREDRQAVGRHNADRPAGHRADDRIRLLVLDTPIGTRLGHRNAVDLNGKRRIFGYMASPPLAESMGQPSNHENRIAQSLGSVIGQFRVSSFATGSPLEPSPAGPGGPKPATRRRRSSGRGATKATHSPLRGCAKPRCSA